MSTLSKLAQYNNNRGVAPTSVGVASKKESTSTLGKLQNYAQQAAEEQARAAQLAEESSKNNGGFFGGLGYLGEKIGLGFLSGIEGIWDYTAGGLAKLFGADDWAEQQFANDWVNYNHADEWYNPSDGWKVAGDVAGGIGTSLPAIAGVAAAAAIAYFSGGTLSGVSAGIISGVVAGLGAAGNATKEAYRETGELGGKEFGYGALSGITEGAVEGLSSAIGAGTGAIVKNMTKSFGKEVAKTTAKAAARETVGKAIIKGFVGEAFEEGLSEFLDPYWKRITYDPNAKNATAQEIGYAALIGGLSGAIMGGFDATVRNTSNTIRGNNIVNNGKATDVINTAQNISNSDIYTEQYESFSSVKSILNELQTSLQKTDGEVRTVKQKMLLGYLERANTYTVFEPMVQKNAARIVANADAIAERLNTYGYTDTQGKPITVTADQIRSGIDPANPKSYAKALKNNDILRTLAVIDATGQLYMDTKKFEASTLAGEQLSSQVDLNRFIENATQDELHAVAEKLDIADWQGLTNEQFKEKIAAFVERGGVQEYRTEQRTNADIKAAADAVDVQKAKTKIPQKFTVKKDGVTRYTTENVDMAIIKSGDSYRIYDYETGKLSKPLTLQQVNAELAEINGKINTATTAAVDSVATEERRQAAEIDKYATENIPAYSKLSDANKSLVRGVIRQARAAGIAEDFALSCARISAKSGLNIVFSKEMSFVKANGTYADGAIDIVNNRIIINPEISGTRTREMLLIHELTHALYNKNGILTVAAGLKYFSADEKEKIRQRYAKIGQGDAISVADEINAHFAEQTLSNKRVLERLVEDKPTIKERILSFFKKSAKTYSSDERLSGAAKKLYGQYKKLFDSFVKENQHSNAIEPSDFGTGTTQIRFKVDGTEYTVKDSTLESDSKGDFLSINLDSDAQKKYSSLSVRERSNFVKKYIKNTFRGVEFTLTDGKRVIITGVDASKMSNTTFAAKHRTALEVDKLFTVAKYDHSYKNPDHRLFSRFDYYTARVKIGNDMYTCTLNVGTTKTDGVLRLYDVNQFVLIKKEVPTQLNEQTTSADSLELLSSTSTNSISENTEKVNSTQGKTSKNVKYALPETDSRGKKLSAQQREFFANSKVVDKDGRLLMVYHGTTNGNFFTFEYDKSRQTGTDYGKAFYFTTNLKNAKGYAKDNHKDPRIKEYDAIRESLKKQILEETDLTKRKELENQFHNVKVDGKTLLQILYDVDYDTGGEVRQLYLNLVNPLIADGQKKQYYEIYPDLFKKARENGNDGIIVKNVYDSSKYGVGLSDVYIAFSPEQIKLTTNETPTVNNDIRYALPDEKTLEFLNSQKTIKVYRAMQVIDGELYPPMAAKIKTIDGKNQLVNASKLGQWEESVERPDLITNGNKFKLDKANGSSITAAYNPYFHTSLSPLNDQFSSAYKRDNLVIVEGEIPQSELTSGYKAQYAKDSVGETQWHSGVVSSKLKGEKARKVILSRWFKPVRIVPNAEVAGVIAKILDGENISVPANVVTPSLRVELEKAGVKIDNNIRFALDDSDRDVRGNYTVGQRAKFAANNTGMKVYTRADAEAVINAIMDERLTFDDGKYGVLKGKDRAAVVDYLFRKLNTVKEGYRIGVALNIADYLIDHTTLSDMYAQDTVSTSMETLSILRGYMHSMDLRSIQGEIKYRYDTKNTINLLWAAPKGERGIAPDVLAQELEGYGITFKSDNSADIFLEMVDMYERAKQDVRDSMQQQELRDYGGEEQLENLRQKIAKDILLAYDNKGTKSKFAKLVEKYTTQIQSLKQQVREANTYNRLVNSIIDKAQKMKDLKLGTFLNATQYKSEVFKSSIEGLARIKNRGNFNIAGTRKILADLRTWYTADNPILADTYEQGIADMLDSLSVGNKKFTVNELSTLNNVMAYFTKYVETFNKVYKNGKWVEAVPEATRYIDTIHANSELKVGLFRKLAGTTYMQTFGDPMTVARRMDMYDPNGFYTETLQQFRDAAVDSQIAEMEVMASYDAFMSKNKKYLAEINKQTVSYGGTNVPKSVIIGLYMTLKRRHAQAGLAQNGFAFVDAEGKRVRVDGFAPNIATDAELELRVIDEQSKIESFLTDVDKQYIAILEQAYNNDAKKLKADRDMQRLGFTNATEDYYYPIRRGNIAKNVDTSDIQGEIDRVTNSSFNKDTVRGAKQELFIESADTVFKRHVHAVCQYAYLSPAIETYNRIFNLDISGNPNKPVSVATESANTWSKGNKYFSKLISDIQGIPTSSGEGSKALGFIRSNYAKFQLGFNPKVWVTQLSSLFASSSILDADSITRGMFVSAKDVDTYCTLAKLRNNDNTVAMAQGVLDKLGKVSDVLMAPIGKMDRFVVCRLFGACQVQVSKNGGAKIGTEANKIAAGQLLRRVILETQQNAIATERSAAMRSGNEILRTVTMFTADSMKVVGRVIDSIGELSTLRAKLKVTTDANTRAALQKSIKLANKKVRKSATALVTSALFMAAVAQLFRWLYNKDDKDDESKAETVLIDFLGNLIGGLPLIKDLYARIAEGYDFDNYAYSSINDLLDSSLNLIDTAKNLVSGDATEQDIAKGVKNLSYSLGQMFGVPTRNIYNVSYGLTKRISPVTAYKIDNKFYKKNYVSDLNKALENDDAEMAAHITGLIYNQRVGDVVNEQAWKKLSVLYSKGYSVLPKSIGDTIRYDGNDIEMSKEQQARFKSIYSQANRYIEKMLASSNYDKLGEEKQAKAIKSVYDAYYYQAVSDLVGQDANNTLGELSRYIALDKLAVIFSGLSDIESDVDGKGKTVAGSKKKKTIAYLLKQNLSDGERLLIMCYRGYAIKDGDYKGYSEQRARIILLKYILSLKSTTQAEKAKIAEECGFTVKNGKIDRSSLYSGIGRLSKNK